MSNKLKINMIIHMTSLICAVVAVQPLPFADLFVLSPIQIVMVNYLNKVITRNTTNINAKEILVYIIGTVGWGVLSQQAVLGLYKTVLPFAGGVTTIPLVYASTFGLGVACKTLLEARINDIKLSKEEIKKIREDAMKSAKEKEHEWSLATVKAEIEKFKSTEFAKYKKQLEKYDKKLKHLESIRLDASNLDISTFLKEKCTLLQNRFKIYNKIELSEKTILNPLIFLSQKELIEVENILAKINRSEIKLNFNYGKYTYSKNNFIDITLSKTNTGYLIENLIIKNPDNSFLKLFNNPNDKSHITNKEIRDKLIHALKTSKYEINISSPWISKNVIDEEFITLFQKALDKNVIIKIRYGIGNSESNRTFNSNTSRNDTSDSVVNYLYEKLSYSKNFKIQKVNSHYKLLICDEYFYIEGSYNFLSFKGDYIDDVRGEGATLGTSREYIKCLRDLYFYF